MLFCLLVKVVIRNNYLFFHSLNQVSQFLIIRKDKSFQFEMHVKKNLILFDQVLIGFHLSKILL